MHLTLHLTTDCNMRCEYCYSPPRSGARMTAEVGRAAMDLGARLNEGSCGIVFFGGEPLLERELTCDLVEYGRFREREQTGRFHFKITTNGLALDAEFLEFSLRHDVLVAMSFDGVREAHDAHRRLPDGSPTFDLLVDRLRMLLDARPYSSVIMVVNPRTAPLMAESASFLLDAGCRYLIVSPNYAAAWRGPDVAVLERQYRELARLYVEWTRAGRKFYLSPFEVKLASHIKGEDFRCERCELGARQLSVDPAGWLYPCVQFTKAGPQSEWCIGNVFDGVDEGRRSELRRLSDAEKRDCAACALRTRCTNTCGCLNWQTTGSVTEVSPFLCRHERMLIGLADRIGETLYRERNRLFLQKHYNPAYPVLSLMEDALGGSIPERPAGTGQGLG